MKLSLNSRNGNRGFGAAVAVMLLSGGMLSISLAALQAASIYSDLVDRSIERKQHEMYEEACRDAATLIRVKDVHAHGKINMKAFNCYADLSI